MHIVLWIAQAVLAVVFVVSGIAKSTRSKQALIDSGQTGVVWYPMPFIRFIALCELLGAAGLILPRALGVAPYLTPIAASGLAVIMIGAALSHARLVKEKPLRRRPELRNVATGVVLFGALAFVAIARFSEL